MEKLESLTLSDTPRSINDLPVEILRGVIDQVVLSSGFYAALELRLVNKLFDVLALDSVLDTSRDEHSDLGYLEASDELAYTALFRRVSDTSTRLPLIVSKIRKLASHIRRYEPSITPERIHEALCHAVLTECGSNAIFNWRKGAAYSSINKKHERLNKELQNIAIEAEADDREMMDWYTCLIYAYSWDFDKLKEIIQEAERRGQKINLDRTSPVFGNIPIIVARYASEEMAIWVFDNSTVCKPHGIARRDFIRYAATYGRISVLEHVANAAEDREERYSAFADCPRWATSAGQLDALNWMVKEGWMAFEDVSKEVNFMFLAACTHGNLKVAKWAVEEEELKPEKGPKTKALRYGRPLCQATQSGNVELVRWLLGIKELAGPEEMIMSFKWAMRYAELDMVKLYLEMGLPVDIDDNNWVGGKIVKAAIDAARKGRAEHLRYVLENGFVFKGGDEHRVVYETAKGGSLKCLQVLREFVEGYEVIAKEEMQKAWDIKHRRAVETLLADGVGSPEGFKKTTLWEWEYEGRIVPTFNWSRKKSGYWPYLWNYVTCY